MDLPTFLSRLRETPRTWRLDENGMVRSACLCPIDVVAGENGAWKHFEPLGLSEGNAIEIIGAADNDEDCDPTLRAALLEACSLPNNGAENG